MKPLWQPTPDAILHSNVTRFMREANNRYSLQLTEYWDLDAWSVAEPEKFWSLVWDFCGVIAEQKGSTVLERGDRMLDARWFPLHGLILQKISFAVGTIPWQ